MKRSFGSSIRRMFGKRFMAGSYSMFAAIVIVIIAVVVNLIAGSLPSTYTQLDLTSSSLLTLSDQTRRIVQSLDKDVNLYLLANDGSEDGTITKLLDRYADLSKHIKVSYIDPTQKPTFLESYDVSLFNLYANSVLVDGGDHYRLVSYTDIYVTSYEMDYYSYNYTTTTEFDGENALTNAIHYVSSDNLPKVYTLSGHGEATLGESIVEMIEQDNMTTESLSLLTLEAVPEDAAAIIIYAPESDLSEDEAAMLTAFLDNGGSILLSTDYFNAEDMPNLLTVTAYMGLTTQSGLIIEGNNQYHMNRYPYYLLPDIESHDITDPLIDGGYYVLAPFGQGITETENSAATVAFLLTTSSDAYAKADGMEAATTEREDGDAEGPFYPAAVAEMNSGKLGWIASTDFLNDSIDRMVSGANSDLYLNTLNWMCEQEETISIRAKTLETNTLTVPGSDNTRWSIMMIGVIPLAFVLTGVIISIRRKRQ